MSWRLNQARKRDGRADQMSPLVTVACHEDLTASDLVGTLSARAGGHTLDRRPAHPRGQARRHLLPGRGRGGAEGHHGAHPPALRPPPPAAHREDWRGVGVATPNFLLVISYNPGYQSALKDLKHSTRQRFIAIEFDFPPRDLEGPIIEHESGVDRHDGAAVGAAWREDTQPDRPGPPGGRQHAPAHLRGASSSSTASRRADRVRSPSSGVSPTTTRPKRALWR